MTILLCTSLLLSLHLGPSLAFAPPFPFLAKAATSSMPLSIFDPALTLSANEIFTAAKAANGVEITSRSLRLEQLSSLPPFPLFLISDVGEEAALLQSIDGGAAGVLRNIFIGAGVIVALLVGLAILSATVIIPAAARELEQECKELAPDMWDEYLRKLEPGQTMAQRPDLIQELGIKLQPLLDAKIQREFADAKDKGIDVSEDEAAWNALDKLNEKVPRVPSMGSSTTTRAEDEGVSFDVTAASNQWDDDEGSDETTSKAK